MHTFNSVFFCCNLLQSAEVILLTLGGGGGGGGGGGVLSHSLNTEEVKKILNIQTVYLLLYFILYCVTVFLYCISDLTQWLLSFCL